MSLRAACTSTNVEPQISVLPARAASARQVRTSLGPPAPAGTRSRSPSASSGGRTDGWIAQQETEGQENAFEPEIAALRVVPLLEGVGAATLTAGADGHGGNAER